MTRNSYCRDCKSVTPPKITTAMRKGDIIGLFQCSVCGSKNVSPIISCQREGCNNAGKKYDYAYIRDRRLTWRFPIGFRWNVAGCLVKIFCDHCFEIVNKRDIDTVYVLHEEHHAFLTSQPSFTSREMEEVALPSMSDYYHGLLEKKLEFLKENGVTVPEHDRDDLSGFDEVWKGRRCDFYRNIDTCPACREGRLRIALLVGKIKKGEKVMSVYGSKACPFLWKRCDLRDEVDDQVAKLEALAREARKHD